MLRVDKCVLVSPLFGLRNVRFKRISHANTVLTGMLFFSLRSFPPEAKMPESYRFRQFMRGGWGSRRTLMIVTTYGLSWPCTLGHPRPD